MTRPCTILLSLLMCITTELLAQFSPGQIHYKDQALMLAGYRTVGSARFQGIGNTGVSLGGDISSALINPAGLGFYNRSEVTITPSLNMLNVSSDYLNNNVSTSSAKFNIDNFGFVFNRSRDDLMPGPFRGGSFAISFSKVNEFNGKYQYAGENGLHDILDYYIQEANYMNKDPENMDPYSLAFGAYQALLLQEYDRIYNKDGQEIGYPIYDRLFFADYPAEDFKTRQTEYIETSGSHNQWNFAYGGNVDDIFYFGLAVGIIHTRYKITKTYEEFYVSEFMDSHRLTEKSESSSLGINATFGIIARPINPLTIGLSIVTPSAIGLNDVSDFSMHAKFKNKFRDEYFNDEGEGYFNIHAGDYFAPYDENDLPDDGIGMEDYVGAETDLSRLPTQLVEESYNSPTITEVDYTVTTPFRANLGASYILGKLGFVSAEMEYVNYSKTRMKLSQSSVDKMSESDYYFFLRELEDQTADIKYFNKAVVNIKAGGELRLDHFRVRGGFGYYPSSVKDSQYGNRFDYTGGLGYKSSKFYTDIAVVYSEKQAKISPYTLETYENYKADLKMTNLSFALTFGFYY